jgi:predicted nucleic acid-binding Zn ribbon protein
MSVIVYEYECSKCGKFEAIDHMTDEQYKEVKKMMDKQLETCPKCGNPCKCLISNNGFDRLGRWMW